MRLSSLALFLLVAATAAADSSSDFTYYHDRASWALAAEELGASLRPVTLPDPQIGFVTGSGRNLIAPGVGQATADGNWSDCVGNCGQFLYDYTYLYSAAPGLRAFGMDVTVANGQLELELGPVPTHPFILGCPIEVAGLLCTLGETQFFGWISDQPADATYWFDPGSPYQGNAVFTLSDIAFGTIADTPAPEPASFALLVAALAALAGYRFRKNAARTVRSLQSSAGDFGVHDLSWAPPLLPSPLTALASPGPSTGDAGIWHVPH